QRRRRPGGRTDPRGAVKSRQCEPADATDAGELVLGTEATVGADTADGAETAEGADADVGALAVDWAVGALTTVTDESVCSRYTVPPRTLPRWLIPSPTSVPSGVRRSIELATAAAPPATMPSPTSPVTAYVIHFLVLISVLSGVRGLSMLQCFLTCIRRNQSVDESILRSTTAQRRRPVHDRRAGRRQLGRAHRPGHAHRYRLPQLRDRANERQSAPAPCRRRTNGVQLHPPGSRHEHGSARRSAVRSHTHAQGMPPGPPQDRR